MTERWTVAERRISEVDAAPKPMPAMVGLLLALLVSFGLWAAIWEAIRIFIL